MAVGSAIGGTRAFSIDIRVRSLTAEWWKTVLVFFISRGSVIACAVSAYLVGPHQGPWGGISVGGPTAIWIAVLSRWDAGWYMSIARDGYAYRPGQESNIAFAPLLPALMRVGGFVLGRTDADALLGVGVLISNIALLIATVYLIRLVSPMWGADLARRTVLCLLFFPTSIFLSAAYPESLFLALSVVAFFQARHGRWWLAGLLGGLAAASRTYGVVLMFPLAFEYIQQHHWRVRRDFLWIGLVPVGFVVWQAYLFSVTGDPLIIRHFQDGFNRPFELPWQGVADLVRVFTTTPVSLSQIGHKGLDAASALVLAILVALTWRLRRASLAIFSSLLFVVIGSGVGFDGVPRYALEVFPAFIVLGRLTRRRTVLAIYLAVACVGSVAITSLFAMGWWIA
jgi:mannosyltransferase PIG-V